MLSKLLSFMPRRGRPKSPYNATGVTGVREYGGFIQSGERNAKVAGRNRYRVYSDNLANISVVAAGVRHFNSLVADAKFSFESPRDIVAGSGEEGEQWTDIAYRVTEDADLSWRQVVKRAGMYRFYGFSLHEIVMERKPDGVILPKVISPRAQYTIHQWDIDAGTGLVKGVVQLNPIDGKFIYIPRSKMLYVTDDSLTTSPEGLGLFRHLVEPVERLKDFQRLEWVGFETDLRGVLKMKAPIAVLRQQVADGVITQAQMDSILNEIKKFAENHVRGKETSILVDSSVYHSIDEAARPSTQPQWDVDLLRAGATSLPDLEKAIERIQREIGRIMGVEQLMLGEGSGSYALAKDKTHSFFREVDSALMDIGHAARRDVLGAVWDINGHDRATLPRVKTETTWVRDPEVIAKTVREIKEAGAIIPPDSETFQELFENLGLPAPSTKAIEQYLQDQMDMERQKAEMNRPPANAGGNGNG